MPASEPKWWYRSTTRDRALAGLLSPAAQIYDLAARLRYRFTTPAVSMFPVICIGNFTAGGSGKTPIALTLADVVREMGHTPWFLSRGYGGTFKGAMRVDLDRDPASLVGDEPRLLAARAPTVVAARRALGLALIERHAPADTLIIMDDGLQNPGIAKDVSIAVVSASRAIGNGRVIPAGPLRASLSFQRSLVDAVLVSGTREVNANTDDFDRFGILSAVPRFNASVAVEPPEHPYAGRTFFAYAGIANPERFFDLLTDQGGMLAGTMTFRDHQIISEDAATQLIEAAHRTGSTLITTEKDLARLSGLTGRCGTLRDTSEVLRIAATFEPATKSALRQLIQLSVKRRNEPCGSTTA